VKITAQITACATGFSTKLINILILLLAALLSNVPASAGVDRWKQIDSKVQPQVFRVNIAIKIRLGDGQYAQLAALSPRMRYPVFVTTSDDKGFRVVGSGSCFAVHSTTGSGTYFLTNRHVVDYAEGLTQECQRFFAAIHAEAERTAGFSSVPERYKQLQNVVNLATRKDLNGSDRSMYEAAVDAIWDTYDRHLSIKEDPTRKEFARHLKAVGFIDASGYFIHGAGSSAKEPLIAKMYKKSGPEPDLALLYCSTARLSGLVLQPTLPRRGDLVQAIGYPVIKQSGVATPADYEPAITIGRVKTVLPNLVQFEAPVSRGDSGGPLINEQGAVVGVVVRRALNTAFENESNKPSNTPAPQSPPSFAAAVSVPSVINFAPELFSVPKSPSKAKPSRNKAH
jgi:S1-C subfamily serine protease